MYKAYRFKSIYDIKNFLNDNKIKPIDIIGVYGVYREHKDHNQCFFDLLYVDKSESETDQGLNYADQGALMPAT